MSRAKSRELQTKGHKMPEIKLQVYLTREIDDCHQSYSQGEVIKHSPTRPSFHFY